MGLFIWTMRKLPEMLCVVALLFYVGSVLAAFIGVGEIETMMGETTPTALKFNIFLKIFAQPLVGTFALLFGAGVLWRLDRRTETAE